jgi:hypothetical protein
MIWSCKVRSRQAQTLWRDEQGLETVEWIAIIFAALALMLAAAVVFSAQGGDVANAALAKLAQFIAGLAGVAPGIGAVPVNPLNIAAANIVTLGIPTLTADMPATAASVAALSFGGASVITWFGGAPGASSVQSTLASVVGATAPQLGPGQVTAGASSGGLLAQVGNFFSQAGSALATAGGFVFDLGKGIVLGAKDAVVGIWEVVKWSYRISPTNWLLNRQDWEQTKDQTLAVLDAIARDPGAALQAIWEGIKEPYVTAWNSRHPGEAIGRGIFDIGSLFIGVGEISAAVKGSTTVARVSSRLAVATQSIRVLDRLGDIGGALRRFDIASDVRRILGRGLNQADTFPPAVQRARPLSTGAQRGLDPTPISIQHGTVRLTDHPDYANALSRIRDAGFDVKVTTGDPRVEILEIVDRQGNLLRVEKSIYLQDGMRYLDLEHELGHLEQQLERLGQIPTHRMVDLGNGRLKVAPNQAGVLTKGQDIITEYHNRLIEYIRLQQRGVDSTLLREHAAGIKQWRQAYMKALDDRYGSSKVRELKAWRDRYFSDITDFVRQYDQLGGPDLE